MTVLRRIRRHLGENWGAPFVLAFIAALILSAVELSLGFSDVANTVAVYAFYALVLGVALQIASYVKYGEGARVEKPEPTPKAAGAAHRRLRIALAISVVAMLLVAGGAYYYSTQRPTHGSTSPLASTSALISTVTTTMTTSSVITSTFTGALTTVSTITTSTAITTTTVVTSTVTVATTNCQNSFFLSPSAPTPVYVTVVVQNQSYVLYSGSGGGISLCYQPGQLTFTAPAKAGNYSFSYWVVSGVSSVTGGRSTLMNRNNPVLTLNLPPGSTTTATLIVAAYGR
jgi:hypothetical protein